MPVIKIEFFKIGGRGSTWIDDEYWNSLDEKTQNDLIEEFVITHYPVELRISKDRHIEPANEQYRWSEM